MSLLYLQVIELNLPEDPCNSAPGYNFFTCVRKSATKTVDLRPSSAFLMINDTRLGVKLNGITGVTIVHHLVVMANNTGGTFSYLILDHKLKFPHVGGTSLVGRTWCFKQMSTMGVFS